MKKNVDLFIVRTPDGSRFSGEAVLDTVTSQVTFPHGQRIGKDEEWIACIKEYAMVHAQDGVFSLLAQDTNGKWHLDIHRKMMTPATAHRFHCTRLMTEGPFMGLFFWESSEMIKDTGLAADQGMIHTFKKTDNGYESHLEPIPVEPMDHFLVQRCDGALDQLRMKGIQHTEEGRWYCAEVPTNQVQDLISKFRSQGIEAGPVPKLH